MRKYCKFDEAAYMKAEAIEANVGANMRAVREAKGMSVYTLSAKIDVTEATIRCNENGKTFPRLSTLIRMATVLGVTLDELVGFPKPEKEEPVDVEESESVDIEGCQMYTKYQGDVPVAYRYGPSWVAMQLMMEGGYPTPEEAREAWERENEQNN